MSTATQTNQAMSEVEQLKALLAAKDAKIAQLEASPKRSVSLKVSEKGAVSMMGMGRFPLTLYKEQWERVLAHSDEIKAFLKANESKLSVKK